MAQSNNLLFVFLLLLCSTLCLSVQASSTGKNGVLEANVFASNTQITEVPTLTKGNKINICIQKINPPALFAAAKDGVIVVIAEVNYKNDGSVGAVQEKFDVVSRNFVAKGNWGEEVFAKVDENNWKTQLVTENGDTTKNFFKIIASTVNADKDKIYVFLLNITDTVKKWEFKLVEGTVNGGTGQKTIKWEKESFTLTKNDEEIKNLFNGNVPELPLTDGSVFLTEKEEQVVFVFKGKFTGTGSDSVVKNVIILFQLKKNQEGAGEKNELKLLNAKSVEGSYSFFQWKGEIFRTPIDNPSGGTNEVMVLKNNNFEGSKDPIARLRDFLKDKQNFVAATIKENNIVLLFTKQKLEDGKNNIYLWMSDGSRVFNHGIIITNVKKFFYGSLLHTGTELFVLYQTYDTESETGELTGDGNKIHLTILNTQLENITKTLKAWKNNSEKIKKFYKDIPTGTNVRITDGLVGFLSNIEENNQWKDEYLNLNATIHKNSKIKKDDNKIAFSGSGAGAVWPVSKTEENEQPYNLNDFGFTLVATVKINGNANKKNSILGIALKEGSNEKRISLWCSDKGKWAVGKKAEPSTDLLSSNKNCEQDESYLVVLMLNKESDKLEVYIDGDKLGITETDNMKITSAETISRFYFGADSEQRSVKADVTIKYVMLYNRPLNQPEINEFKIPEKKKVTNPKETDSGNNMPGQEKDDKTGTQPDTSVTQTTTEKEDKQSSPPPTTEDGAVRVGVVGVLCFMLFDVFKLLGRYVY